MTEHEKRIREALEAGPTEGPWFEHHHKGRLYIENQRDDVVCDMGLRVKSNPTSQFIAACNPSTIRALLADLDAARAALSEAKAGGWLPIESAPKDGTAVLVSEGRFCSCVEWNEEFDWWAVDDNKLGPFRLRGAAPTHWQPLPTPPKEQA